MGCDVALDSLLGFYFLGTYFFNLIRDVGSATTEILY